MNLPSNNPSLNNVNKENSKQQNDNSGNMYSYQDDNKINNPNELEAQAIRRSIGNGNPNADIGQPSYNPEYSPYLKDMNKGNVQIVQSQTNYYSSNNSCVDWVPYILFGFLELLFILLIGVCFKWDIRNEPKYHYIENEIKILRKEEPNGNKTDLNWIIYNTTEEDLNTYDGIFKDINVMIFVGFGMFHTLLKRYSWTSITINMMAIALSFQIGLFTNLLWKNAFKESWKKGVLNFKTFIESNIISCSVLVSLGCVLGKLTPTQYILMIVFETIVSSLNFQLCDTKLKAIDVGGSLYIHTFGTIFGIAIYLVQFCSKKMKSKVLSQNHYNKSYYFSNVTSFIGVLFLCFYFPSFNSGLALDNDQRYRATINTYLSIAGSIIGSLIASGIFFKGRIVIEHILFGCFSGGVIISGCCSVCIDLWASLLIGFLCGGITTTLLIYLKPFLIKWQFYDIYNIIIIHGIPGILGALITSMVIGGFNLRKEDSFFVMLNDSDRSNSVQAGIQIGAIFITLGLSFVSGIAIGYLMKVSNCGKIEQFFTDSEFFVNEPNVIDNLEYNQFYDGIINRASLFQNRISRLSDIKGSQPSYINEN